MLSIHVIIDIFILCKILLKSNYSDLILVECAYFSQALVVSVLVILVTFNEAAVISTVHGHLLRLLIMYNCSVAKIIIHLLREYVTFDCLTIGVYALVIIILVIILALLLNKVNHTFLPLTIPFLGRAVENWRHLGLGKCFVKKLVFPLIITHVALLGFLAYGVTFCLVGLWRFAFDTLSFILLLRFVAGNADKLVEI